MKITFVIFALSTPADLRFSHSLPAVGMKRSPEPISTRMSSCPIAINVTLVGELYCSPICPADLSSVSRSAGGASGARKLVGSTRCPSLTTVRLNAPCSNAKGDAARVGRVPVAMLAAVAARSVRRFSIMTAFSKACAFYAKAASPATRGGTVVCRETFSTNACDSGDS